MLQNSKPTVIVIGAGASGMTAAENLIKFGFDPIILEASDRFGGRVCKNTSFSDYNLELGGEEIYNPSGEYFKLCLKAGADIYKRKDGCTYIEHPTEKRMMNFDEFWKRYPQEADIIDLLIQHYEKYPRDMRPLSEFWEYFELDPLFKFWGEECLG